MANNYSSNENEEPIVIKRYTKNEMNKILRQRALASAAQHARWGDEWTNEEANQAERADKMAKYVEKRQKIPTDPYNANSENEGGKKRKKGGKRRTHRRKSHKRKTHRRRTHKRRTHRRRN